MRFPPAAEVWWLACGTGLLEVMVGPRMESKYTIMKLHLTIIAAGLFAAASACDVSAQSVRKLGPSRGQVQPSAPQGDALGDMSQTQALRLQIQMDRRAKLLQMQSNIMKNNAKTQQGIIQNMK